MAKYLVVYSYQDEKQPLLRKLYNDVVEADNLHTVTDHYQLFELLGFKWTHREHEQFVVENLIKLGD